MCFLSSSSCSAGSLIRVREQRFIRIIYDDDDDDDDDDECIALLCIVKMQEVPRKASDMLKPVCLQVIGRDCLKLLTLHTVSSMLRVNR